MLPAAATAALHIVLARRRNAARRAPLNRDDLAAGEITPLLLDRNHCLLARQTTRNEHHATIRQVADGIPTKRGVGQFNRNRREI